MESLVCLDQYLNSHTGGLNYESFPNSMKEFMSTIHENFSEFDDLEWAGCLVESKKAEKLGYDLMPPLRVEEMEIECKEEEPRWIRKVEKPIPTRKEVVLYEDISFLQNLMDRERWIDQIIEAEFVATEKGKDFMTLDIDDVPCNYYSPTFMKNRSAPRGDSREYALKNVITQVPAPKKKVGVTVWAEGSKAMSRYSKAFGLDKLIVLYPEDLPSDKHESHVKYAATNAPGLEIEKIDTISLSKLAKISSQEFVEMYSLPKNSLFIINYLPQCMHLRHEFAYFVCIYLDREVIERSEVASLPPVQGDASYRLNHYQRWFHDKRPEIVSNGHGGIYDPLRKVRISYSQHGVFEDYIVNSNDMIGSDFVTRYISSMVEEDVDTKVKIAYSLEDKYPATDDEEDEINSDIDYSNILWQGGNEIPDLSQFNLPYEDVLYIPFLKTIEIETTSTGCLLWQGIKYGGFPRSRILTIAQDINYLVVVDIAYSRKDYFARRSRIPEKHRVPYNKNHIYACSYVVFFNTYSPVVSFKSTPLAYSPSGSRRGGSPDLKQYLLEGVGWNHTLGRLVLDEKSLIYGGPISFDYSSIKDKRFYEFDIQNRARTAFRFSTLDLHWEILSSSSTMILPIEFLRSTLFSKLKVQDVLDFTLNLIPYYSQSSDPDHDDIDLGEASYVVDNSFLDLPLNDELFDFESSFKPITVSDAINSRISDFRGYSVNTPSGSLMLDDGHAVILEPDSTFTIISVHTQEVLHRVSYLST